MTTPQSALLGSVMCVLALTGFTGCEQAPKPGSAKAGTAPPPDSICPRKSPQGLCIIALGVGVPSAVQFEAQPGHLRRLADGSLQVSDELILVTPMGRWTFIEAKVIFKPAPGGGFDRIDGEARVPFDSLPILKQAKTGGGVMAAIGYDRGKNLSELDAPLQPETHYLFFAFKENFGVSFGFDDLGIPVRGGDEASKPFSFSPIPAARLVMALDASDPFFYVSAKGLSPKKKKKQPDEDEKKKPSLNIGGFGYSYQGRIPEAVNTPDFSKQMLGNLVLEGSVPFPPAPVIQYTGYYLTRQDATLQAISGDISFGFPLKFLLNFGISLGDATAIAEVNDEHAEVLLAGRFHPDTSWVPTFIPLLPEADVRLAARLDTGNAANNFVHGTGSYAIVGSEFAPQGLKFGKVFSEQGEFRITIEQIEMQGAISRDLAPFKFREGASFTAVVGADKQDRHLDINGDILIGALDTRGHLAVTPRAVSLDAELNAGADWRMALQGTLHDAAPRGLTLSGRFEVPQALDGRVAKAVTQQVDQATHDLQNQIAELARQLNQLTADLPGVRAAAKKAAREALRDLDTNNHDAIVNKEIATFCKGKVIPSTCEGLARSAYNRDKQVEQVKNRLHALISALNTKDDEQARSKLKNALHEVIHSNPVSVDFEVHKKTVTFLGKHQKDKLQAAIQHIDKLKSTGDNRVKAQGQMDDFTKSTLNEIGQQIKQGVNPISVQKVTFDMPATRSGPIDLRVSIALNGTPRNKPLTITFDPQHPEKLPEEIANKLQEALR